MKKWKKNAKNEKMTVPVQQNQALQFRVLKATVFSAMVFFRNRGFFSGSLRGCFGDCFLFWETVGDFVDLEAAVFPVVDFPDLGAAVFFFPAEAVVGCFFFSVSFAVKTASFFR